MEPRPTEIYPLSLHDALPIYALCSDSERRTSGCGVRTNVSAGEFNRTGSREPRSKIGRAHVWNPGPPRSTLFPYTTLFRSMPCARTVNAERLAAASEPMSAPASSTGLARESHDPRSGGHTYGTPAHRDLPSFPTRRSSDLCLVLGQ